MRSQKVRLECCVKAQARELALQTISCRNLEKPEVGARVTEREDAGLAMKLAMRPG